MKKIWKYLLFLMTIVIVLVVGLKFDGNLEHLLKQRTDFISNIQMGGDRITFSFESLKYYIFYITEPFALLNISGNIGLFAVFGFLACGTFLNKKTLYSCLYCSFWGIAIELIQYFTWLGFFDISDILLRFIGILIGSLIYTIVFTIIRRRNRNEQKVGEKKEA